MSANRIVQQALTNRHLEEQGVPNQGERGARVKSARPVVWGPWLS